MSALAVKETQRGTVLSSGTLNPPMNRGDLVSYSSTTTLPARSATARRRFAPGVQSSAMLMTSVPVSKRAEQSSWNDACRKS